MALKVLFDEAHSEAWTIRAEVASRMQPAHPADASYGLAADLLRGADFDVTANTDAPLSAERLATTDLLVIAHPSAADWEATTDTGSPQLSPDELDAIERYVRDGGGLVVLGETEQDKYGNNVNELLGRFGIRLRNETVQDYENSDTVPSWIRADLQNHARGAGGDLLARVRAVLLYRATTIETANGAAVLARTHASATVPNAPVIVADQPGEGRVVVLADSDLFGDDCIDSHDHRALWLNIANWTARHSVLETAGAATETATRPDWLSLRDATNSLALMQAPDGSLRDDASRVDASARVEQILTALVALAGDFPHLPAAAQDLEAWRDGGYVKPDFTAALEAFRPERQRVDGQEQVVFFPMYKQNGSPDTCFEAILLSIPWPDWIAALEATRYDNPKYLPVQLIDATAGYDSECAVLFPEMVAVTERQPNHWGAIFCDREAARLRRVTTEAADLLQMNLPPDAARLLASPEVAKEAFILWDLIHDRAHSHGDLPFDPFMVRQRAPYWMYSLEELRCDLTAFSEAVQLEAEGVMFARNVQYAVLFDRLLRFPITGPRVRNYDGLGGQLLFAYLHHHGHLHWTDNQLTIEWARVADGVIGLREEILALYKTGIGRTKLQHWSAAHDLISAYVPPASGSNWVKGERDLVEVEDPRPYCDLVLPDEFPLSIFYSALARAITPA